jgi:hypothetical protein
MEVDKETDEQKHSQIVEIPQRNETSSRTGKSKTHQGSKRDRTGCRPFSRCRLTKLSPHTNGRTDGHGGVRSWKSRSSATEDGGLWRDSALQSDCLTAGGATQHLQFN